MFKRISSSLSVTSFLLLAALCSSCTRAELVNKADAYDAAIWDASNRQVLLNAVRASQRAPMSFVGYGDVLASPNFSGGASATGNFIPSGLSTYSVNPSVSYGGGFASFQMGNLNQKDFARAMHEPLTKSNIAKFMSEKWPKELVDLVLTQMIVLSPTEAAFIESRRSQICQIRPNQRAEEICTRIDNDVLDRRQHDCPASPNPLAFLNSAREFCSMNRFQILARTLRLVGFEPRDRRYRSAEGILYFLGELIAAQQYSAQQHVPMVYIYASDGHHYLMRLFVVERGNPGPPLAAVQVSLNGEDFFIPRPQLGALDEDRSLQVLDMAATAIVLATTKDNLPKSNNVSLIAGR